MKGKHIHHFPVDLNFKSVLRSATAVVIKLMLPRDALRKGDR